MADTENGREALLDEERGVHQLSYTEKLAVRRTDPHWLDMNESGWQVTFGRWSFTNSIAARNEEVSMGDCRIWHIGRWFAIRFV